MTLAARVFGEGADAHALRARANVLPCDVLVVPLGQEARAVTTHEATSRTPYAAVWREPGAVWIGPARRPGDAGCPVCAVTRRLHAHAHRDAFEDARRAALPALTAAHVDQIALLLRRPAPSPHAALRPVWRLEWGRLRAHAHGLLPVSDCPVCGARPDDAPPAPPEFPAVPKVAAHHYRPPSDGLETLWQHVYVDDHLGLIRDVRVHPVSLFYDVGASAGMPGYAEPELTSGRGVQPEKSRLAAVAEALERYGGIRPFGRATAVHARYRDVAGCAVDPHTLGTHDPEALARGDSSVVPFDPARPMNWVWATSLLSARPTLVPERYAYYGLPAQVGATSFYETSNGCAVGRSLTEAALFGLLELIERDAFLLSWYARLPLPRIDLERAAPPTLRWKVERVQSLTGYRLEAYDMTLDLGVPAVWMMAVNARGNADAPFSVHAAAAHLDPLAALEGALHEVAPGIPYAARRYADARPTLLRQLHDPHLVRRMRDHAALYWLPETAERLEFLRHPGATTALTDWRARAPRPHGDLRDDLEHLLSRLRAAGLDVLMVDQTAPEHEAGGLRCVKMIVPGLLPMTFGHAHRRLHHLPRLRSVPAGLGRPPAPLNLHPHPFP